MPFVGTDQIAKLMIWDGIEFGYSRFITGVTSRCPISRIGSNAASRASKAAVKLMRTRIGLLAQPKSMRSIIDATQREQRHGSA